MPRYYDPDPFVGVGTIVALALLAAFGFFAWQSSKEIRTGFEEFKEPLSDWKAFFSSPFGIIVVFFLVILFIVALALLRR